MNAPRARTSRVLLGAVVVLPLLVLMGRASVLSDVFAFRDASHYYYPQYAWEDRHWRSGVVPLWNPQDNLGTSVAADPTAALFYPGKLLLRLPLPYPTRFKLYTLAHLFWAAAGMYAAARAWRCSPAGSALAALSYAASGNVLFLYSNVVYLVGAAWLPWASAMFELAVRHQSIRAWLALAAALAMMILGGDPQSAAHLLLLGLIRILWGTPRSDENAATRTTSATCVPTADTSLSTRSSRTRQLVGLVVTGAIALSLAAPQAIPTWLAAKQSARAAFDEPRTLWEIGPWSARDEKQLADLPRGLFSPPAEGSHHQQLYDFSVGPWRLVELFVPNALGKMFPQHKRWGFAIPAESRVWTPSLYQGLLPMLLALAAVLGTRAARRHPTERWLTMVSLFAILGGCGSYGPGWLVRELCGDLSLTPPEQLGDATGGVYWWLVVLVPSFVQFRYPAKLWTLAALAIAGLAARGFDRMVERGESPDARSLASTESEATRRWLARLALASLVAAGSLLVVFGILAVTGAWQHLVQNVADDAWLGPFLPTRALVDTVVGLSTTGLIGAFAWRWAKGMRSGGRTRGALCLAVVAVDLVVAHQWLVVTAPVDAWNDAAPALDAIDRARFVHSEASGALPATWQSESSDERLTETVRWDAAQLQSKMHLLGSASSIESPVAAESLDYRSLLQVLRTRHPTIAWSERRPPPEVLDLLSVNALLVPNDGVTAIPSVNDAAPSHIEPRPGAGQRAWLVRHVELIAPATTLETQSPRAAQRRVQQILYPGSHRRDWRREAVVEGTEIPAEFALLNATPAVPASGEAKVDASTSNEKAASVDESSAARPQDAITFVEDALHHVTLDVTLPSPALLVLADRFDPDWRVEVRDAEDADMTAQSRATPTQLLRTNHVCRGVWLPAGRWRVDFRYRPWSVYAGLALGGASWLAWLLAITRWSTRGRT